MEALTDPRFTTGWELVHDYPGKGEQAPLADAGQEPSSNDAIMGNMEPPSGLNGTGQVFQASTSHQRIPVQPSPWRRDDNSGSSNPCFNCHMNQLKCDETERTCAYCVRRGFFCTENQPDPVVDKAKGIFGPNGQVEFTLPVIFPGVETRVDRLLFKYYTEHLCCILSVGEWSSSSFGRIVLPMACRDQGLMHSILSLSGAQFNRRSDYTYQLMRSNSGVEPGELEARSEFHEIAALKFFTDPKRVENLPAANLQLVFIVLRALFTGNTTGAHRILAEYPLDAPPCTDDRKMAGFFIQFFQYHSLADKLIAMPRDVGQEWKCPEVFHRQTPPPLPPVPDSLFSYMTVITELRDRIRRRMVLGLRPAAQPSDLAHADAIYGAIQEWEPHSPQGGPYGFASDHICNLYKAAMSTYLWRSVLPLQHYSGWVLDSRISDAMSRGLNLIIKNESEAILHVLLAPAFMFGCAAFKYSDRGIVRAVINKIEAFMGQRNIPQMLRVLEETWKLMDKRDEDKSWDWQRVAFDMGLDFLPA